MFTDMQTRRFLMVGAPRSGTTVTMNALSGHPQVTTCGDEVQVRPLFTRGSSVFTYGNESLRARSHYYQGLFDALTSDPSRAPGAMWRARGMKVTVGDAPAAIDLANCLRNHLPDLHVVFVCRQDLVAQFASLHRARSTGVWHSWQGAQNTESQSTLPGEEFSKYARTMLRTANQIRSLNDTHSFYEMSYEGEIEQGNWEGLYRFLGLDVCEPTWLRMSKVSPPARDYVANYDELQRLVGEVDLPDAEFEMKWARSRQQEQERQESPQVLIQAARDHLDSGRFEDAERLSIFGLESESALKPSLLASGFHLLELAWEELDDAGRAERGLKQLEPRFADHPEWSLLAGLVRYRAGQRQQGIDHMARAAAADNARAAKLLAEWQCGQA